MILSRLQQMKVYKELIHDKDVGACREYCQNDLYFLLRIAMRRSFMDNVAKPDWLYDRVREYEASPDGYLDLWAREHFKSTIITFAGSIQEILRDPEITIGIFSHTRPIAKKFLFQIATELETNDMLLSHFPEIFWQKPRSEAPKWSLDAGILVRRKQNPAEATVEAWGLVDSQPTSAHFKLRVYDDVVVRKSVGTPEQIAKTTEAWELSLNLGSGEDARERYAGTIYHYFDTYKTIMDRKHVIPRIYPGTKDGTVTGKPVLRSPEFIAKKRRSMGRYVFDCQILLNPKAEDSGGFQEEQLEFWGAKQFNNLNRYILVDPANEKNKASDYSAFWVIGLGEDGNYYVITFIRDKLNLDERTALLFSLHRDYKPLAVGYEKYGMQSDISHIKSVQRTENYRFKIIPLGGPVGKHDRIKRLVPIAEQGRIWLPHRVIRKNWEGDQVDMIQQFIQEEWIPFPVAMHDDGLDALARLEDPDFKAKLKWPGGKSANFDNLPGQSESGGDPLGRDKVSKKRNIIRINTDLFNPGGR